MACQKQIIDRSKMNSRATVRYDEPTVTTRVVRRDCRPLAQLMQRDSGRSEGRHPLQHLLTTDTVREVHTVLYILLRAGGHASATLYAAPACSLLQPDILLHRDMMGSS